jgi:hypothetical protein
MDVLMSERERNRASSEVGAEADADESSHAGGTLQALVDRFGPAGAQRIIQRERARRRTNQAAAGSEQELAGPEVPKPDEGAPVKNDELVVTRDPSQAIAAKVDSFRNQLSATITGWGLHFDPATVRLAPTAAGSGAGNAIVLDWLPSWGTRPTTRELTSSLRPVDARVAQTAVHALGGWSKLKPAEQSTVDNLLGGETNDLSNAARQYLRPKLPQLSTKSEEEQGKTLTGLIGNQAAMPAVVDEHVDAKPVEVTLAGPTEKKGFAFRGKTADAESWQATFSDGTKVEIVAPKAPEPGYHNHSVQDAADAARYLPKQNRAAIKQILLNAVVNPQDSYWAAQYHRPDFHSYMTAGAAGIVTIYPNKTEKPMPNANYMRGTMIHESGHTLSHKLWGNDETKGKWLDWRKAMAADGVSVSGYAMAALGEDVAETIQVYGSTKGTPRFEEYKAMVPNRFAILTRELP